MSVERLLVDWKTLKKMGWPYDRAHTWRLMSPGWWSLRKTKDGGVTRIWIPNRDPFPQCTKLGNGRNGHPVWRYKDILDYFKRHGLTFSDV